MKSAIFVFVFLFAIASVHAAGLNPVSPVTDATVDPGKNAFSFSTFSADIVQECSLLIDGERIKNISYKDSLRSRTINYLVPVEDGNHTWQVICKTDAGILDTPVRAFSAKNAKNSNVKVTPSGVFRGSFLHSFEFTNSPSQEPVEITGTAPGDFIEITLLLPPSRLVKELYVKQLSAKNDERYLVIEDTKLNVNYYLYEGKNETVNVSGSRIIMSYAGSEKNKATVIVYSAAQQISSPGTASPEPPVEAPAPNEETDTPAPAENTEKPVESPPAKPVVTPDASNTKADAPKQGGLKRFLSWLSNVFG